jgi:hypothetical protein
LGLYCKRRSRGRFKKRFFVLPLIGTNDYHPPFLSPYVVKFEWKSWYGFENMIRESKEEPEKDDDS